MSTSEYTIAYYLEYRIPMKKIVTVILLALLSSPALATPKPTDPILVYKINSVDDIRTYTKPYQQIKLDKKSLDKLNSVIKKMAKDSPFETYQLYAIRVSESLDIAMFRRRDGLAFKTYDFTNQTECAMFLDTQGETTAECSKNGEYLSR